MSLEKINEAMSSTLVNFNIFNIFNIYSTLVNYMRLHNNAMIRSHPPFTNSAEAN